MTASTNACGNSLPRNLRRSKPHVDQTKYAFAFLDNLNQCAVLIGTQYGFDPNSLTLGQRSLQFSEHFVRRIDEILGLNILRCVGESGISGGLELLKGSSIRIGDLENGNNAEIGSF